MISTLHLHYWTKQAFIAVQMPFYGILHNACAAFSGHLAKERDCLLSGVSAKINSHSAFFFLLWIEVLFRVHWFYIIIVLWTHCSYIHTLWLKQEMRKNIFLFAILNSVSLYKLVIVEWCGSCHASKVSWSLPAFQLQMKILSLETRHFAITRSCPNGVQNFHWYCCIVAFSVRFTYLLLTLLATSFVISSTTHFKSTDVDTRAVSFKGLWNTSLAGKLLIVYNSTIHYLLRSRAFA